jgi:hypothetical protein
LVDRFERLPLAGVLAHTFDVRLDAEELGRYPARLPPTNKGGFHCASRTNSLRLI